MSDLTDAAVPAEPPATVRELLKRRDFMLFWTARVASTLGVQI